MAARRSLVAKPTPSPQARWSCHPVHLLAVSLAILFSPALALSASVHPLFNLGAPEGGPFPSDRFTVPDATQNTGLRIALPKPDCAARPSDCADLDVINVLDGFNLLPRLSIPFDGSIDPASATSGTVFLVSLGSTLPGGEPSGHVVGIDQIVWDPPTMTLHLESDELLGQHARYALVVTKEVHDPDGKEIKAARAFLDFTDEAVTGSTGDPILDAYRSLVRSALAELDSRGIVSRGRVVAASVFTTLSASASLEKIRDAIKAGTPAPANFLLGPGGARAVFDWSAVRMIRFLRQTSTNPADPLSPQQLPGALNVVPGAVGRLALGGFSSPDYRVHPGEFIPEVGTLSGHPAVLGTNDITFILFLPSKPKPVGGYPIVIYGHGGGTDKITSGFVAAKLAQKGIATIAIDGPGHGFGPLSAYAITFTDQTSDTILSGGRGLDQNGDGIIGGAEGFSRAQGLGRGDGDRQRAADHMQLVRVIQVGVDVDGDGSVDLDPSRIYYLGVSQGANQGAVFLAVEPDVRAGVLNVLPGSGEQRLGSGRGGLFLQSRVPPLLNSPGVTQVDGIAVDAPYFNENLPLRHGAPFSVVLEDASTQTVRSPLVNMAPGSIAIQQVMERGEWALQPANSVAHGSYLRRHPLAGVSPKAMIVQLAYGDRVVPNPSTAEVLRAGDLSDRATFVRTDLAFPVNPIPFPMNVNLYPHAFLQIFGANFAALTNLALQAEEQIASFFDLDGTDHVLDPFDASQVIDPDATGPIFEVPITLPLPTRLNYPLSGSPAALSANAHRLAAPIEPSGDPPDRTDSHGTAPLVTWPVPYRGGTLHVSFVIDNTERSGKVQTALEIYDLTGRCVRRIPGSTTNSNRIRLTWDGRNDHGAAVAPGVYLLRATGGGRATEAKIVVFRR